MSLGNSLVRYAFRGAPGLNCRWDSCGVFVAVGVSPVVVGVEGMLLLAGNMIVPSWLRLVALRIGGTDATGRSP